MSATVNVPGFAAFVASVIRLPAVIPSTIHLSTDLPRPSMGRPILILSPLATTLMNVHVNVANKGLTVWLNPLDRTLTRTGDTASMFGRPHPSHCSRTPLVQQFRKARDFFTIRGNNSAPPG